MPWLIAYDIENDRLRDKTAARLLAAGCIRLQKSVFAGQLDGVLFKELETWLKKHLDPGKYPDDKVLLLNLGPGQLKNARWIGSPPSDLVFLTDPPDVLFM